MSSLTNFAVAIYVARTLGGGAVRRVQPLLRDLWVRAPDVAGPFHRPVAGQVQRHRRPHLAACRCQLLRDSYRTYVGFGTGACVRFSAAVALLGGTARLAFLALGLTLPLLLFAGQLAVCVLRGRAWQPGIHQRHGLGGDATSRPGVPVADDRPCERVLVRFRLGCHRGAGGPGRRAAAGPGRAEADRRAWEWLSRQRDLGLALRRAEGHRHQRRQSTLRNYSVSVILGLATLGYLQAATALMGPFQDHTFWGWVLVALPELPSGFCAVHRGTWHCFCVAF